MSTVFEKIFFSAGEILTGKSLKGVLSMVNIQKTAVIGCGFVGSATAYSMMRTGIFSEMVLIDVNRAKAEGESMDISHGLPFSRPMAQLA